MGFNGLKYIERIRGDSLVLITQFPGVLGIHKWLHQNCRIVRSNLVLGSHLYRKPENFDKDYLC